MRPPSMQEEESLLMDNLEQLLWEINEFCGRGADKQEEIPEPLENYLKYVAKTGNTVFPWQHVRPLFRCKMLKAMSVFEGEIFPNEGFIMERFDVFRAAPFTIQRFAELVTEPKRHYSMKEKYLRGLEKTVLVVTTVEPKSLNPDDDDDEDSSNENGREAEPMMWFTHSDSSLDDENGSDQKIHSTEAGGITTQTEITSETLILDSVTTFHPRMASTDLSVTAVTTTQILTETTNGQIKSELMDQCQDGIAETVMPSNINSTEAGFSVKVDSPEEDSKSSLTAIIESNISNEAEIVPLPENSQIYVEPELTTVETESVITEIGSDIKSEVSDVVATSENCVDSTELCMETNQADVANPITVQNLPFEPDLLTAETAVTSSLSGDTDTETLIPALTVQDDVAFNPASIPVCEVTAETISSVASSEPPVPIVPSAQSSSSSNEDIISDPAVFPQPDLGLDS